MHMNAGREMILYCTPSKKINKVSPKSCAFPSVNSARHREENPTHTHTHTYKQNYEKPKTLYTTDLSTASDAKNDPGDTGDIKPWSPERVILKLIQFYPITLRELKWMRSKLGRAREARPTTFEVTAVHPYHPSAQTQTLSAPSNGKPGSAFTAFSAAGTEGKLSSQADPQPLRPTYITFGRSPQPAVPQFPHLRVTEHPHSGPGLSLCSSQAGFWVAEWAMLFFAKVTSSALRFFIWLNTTGPSDFG